jgi:hypothetical protein
LYQADSVLFSYSGDLSDDVNGDGELQAMNIRYKVDTISTAALMKTTSVQIITHGIVDDPRMYMCALTIFVSDTALN